MSLILPKYIPIDYIQNMPVQHEWDDWDPYTILPEPDRETKLRLSRLSYLAIVVYSIGCAEWTVYRFGKLSSDLRPYDYLENCWAWVMSKSVMAPPETEDEEWEGPIRGPIDMALVTVLNTIYAVYDAAPEDSDEVEHDDVAEEDGEEEDEEEMGPTEDAAFSESIARYVLNDESLFMEWKENILHRLEKYYPITGDDPWGPPIPREVLDPAVDLKPEMQENLTKMFLDNIDYDKNEFIVLLDEGQTNR